MNPNLNLGNGPQRVVRAASASHGTGLVRIGPTSQRPGVAGARAHGHVLSGPVLQLSQGPARSLPLEDRVLLLAAYRRTNLTLRQLAPLPGSRSRPPTASSTTSARHSPLQPRKQFRKDAVLMKEEHNSSPRKVRRRGGTFTVDRCVDDGPAAGPGDVTEHRGGIKRTGPPYAGNAMGRWTYCPRAVRDTESLSRPHRRRRAVVRARRLSPNGRPDIEAPSGDMFSLRGYRQCRARRGHGPASGLRNRTEFSQDRW
jgi:hypothetical protein